MNAPFRDDPSCTRFATIAVLLTLFDSAPLCATAADCDGSWTLRTMSPRWAHAMTHDPERGVTVVFGGISGAADTWEWDGEHWELRAIDGPSSRWGHAMCYDSVRRRVLLTGGRADSDGLTIELGDTWDWDGQIWRLVNKDEAPARSLAGLAFDDARGVAVLFGGMRIEGSDRYYFGDTWEWDGEHWTQAASEGPPARLGGKLAYDLARQQIVLFGGSVPLGERTKYFRDTWVWDGATWTLATQNGPAPRAGHAMAFDTKRERVVLTGGYEGRPLGHYYYADTWEWNGRQWHNRSRFAYTGSGMEAAYDSRRGVTVLYGGETPSHHMEGAVYEWDGDTWEQRTRSPMISRFGHGVAYDSQREETVLYGGAVGSLWGTGALNETWSWDGQGWRFREQGPAGSAFHQMAYDPLRDRVVLAGGASSDVVTPRTWEWDGATWYEVFGDETPVDTEHSMTFDMNLGETLTHYGDTYSWDGERWLLRSEAGPVRYGAAMAYDERRKVTVLFGGGSDPVYGDTWEFDANEQWSRVSETGPPARSYHVLVYDARRGTTLLFGGYSLTNDVPNDLWEWDGGAWHRLSAVGPTRRLYAAAAFDRDRGVMILVGGLFYGPLGDTWEYRSDPRRGDGNCDGSVDLEDVDFFVAALVDDEALYSKLGGSVACWSGRRCWADVNRDGSTDFADIDGFVVCLTDGCAP